MLALRARFFLRQLEFMDGLPSRSGDAGTTFEIESAPLRSQVSLPKGYYLVDERGIKGPLRLRSEFETALAIGNEGTILSG